jgi:hypothetical protein
MITSGEGKYKVFLEEKKIEKDLLYVLTGGEKPHIGGIVICEPSKEPQVIRLGNHYDYIVLEPIAKTACKKYNTTVVAVGGIHIDDATKNDIERLVGNCNNLIKYI